MYRVISQYKPTALFMAKTNRAVGFSITLRWHRCFRPDWKRFAVENFECFNHLAVARVLQTKFAGHTYSANWEFQSPYGGIGRSDRQSPPSAYRLGIHVSITLRWHRCFRRRLTPGFWKLLKTGFNHLAVA